VTFDAYCFPKGNTGLDQVDPVRMNRGAHGDGDFGEGSPEEPLSSPVGSTSISVRNYN